MAPISNDGTDPVWNGSTDGDFVGHPIASSKLDSPTLLVNESETRSSQEEVHLKEPKKPKRPLSAYNVFFKQERERLLAATHLPANRKKPPRNSHGKIGFAELARHIAGKWKDLPDEDRMEFETRSQIDKDRYYREMAFWKKNHERHATQQQQQMKKKKSASSKQVNHIGSTSSFPSHGSVVGVSTSLHEAIRIKSGSLAPNIVTSHLQAGAFPALNSLLAPQSVFALSGSQTFQAVPTHIPLEAVPPAVPVANRSFLSLLSSMDQMSEIGGGGNVDQMAIQGTLTEVDSSLTPAGGKSCNIHGSSSNCIDSLAQELDTEGIEFVLDTFLGREQ